MENAKGWWIAIAVIVVVIIVAMVAGNGEGNPLASVSPSVSGSESVSPSASPVASATAKPLTYGEALKKYASTRIQLDTICQATPNYMVVKTGTTIMLDNRSAEARVVALDTAKYNLLKYGFRLVTLRPTKLPYTFTIDCGASQNVGRILVER